jgi:hypothetical protein
MSLCDSLGLHAVYPRYEALSVNRPLHHRDSHYVPSSEEIILIFYKK